MLRRAALVAWLRAGRDAAAAAAGRGLAWLGGCLDVWALLVAAALASTQGRGASFVASHGTVSLVGLFSLGMVYVLGLESEDKEVPGRTSVMAASSSFATFTRAARRRAGGWEAAGLWAARHAADVTFGVGCLVDPVGGRGIAGHVRPSHQRSQ